LKRFFQQPVNSLLPQYFLSGIDARSILAPGVISVMPNRKKSAGKKAGSGKTKAKKARVTKKKAPLKKQKTGKKPAQKRGNGLYALTCD